MTDVTGVGNEGWLRCAPAPHCRCWAMGDLQENAQLFQGAGKGRGGGQGEAHPYAERPQLFFPLASSSYSNNEELHRFFPAPGLGRAALKRLLLRMCR